ncbi:hypothetical protein [Haloactinopolyspora sp.]|uniref:hypothetical protein n=1 Tax=Haloactinopolyspora sp. TaxID=1966353 RepID=UPI002630538B|nr:hypothetical protein [Haloactinopolyspora sp.]
MDTPAMPDESPQVVPPMPVPVTVMVGGAQTPVGMMTVLRIDSPTGMHVSFLGRDQALELASMLRHQAQTGSRLVVPTGDLSVPK